MGRTHTTHDVIPTSTIFHVWCVFDTSKSRIVPSNTMAEHTNTLTMWSECSMIGTVSKDLYSISQIKCAEANKTANKEGQTIVQITFKCKIEGCDKELPTESCNSPHENPMNWSATRAQSVVHPSRGTELATHVATCTDTQKATFICTAGDGCQASFAQHTNI